MNTAKRTAALSREEFRELVAQAIASLPLRVIEHLSNVDIVVEARPTSEELAMAGTDPGETLFGLYTGIPLSARSSSYGMVLPDKITLYQRSIEEGCRTNQEIQAQIRITLLHEIGHHFGLSEDELHEAGYE
ncbi:Possibl zinc metallo-peptidase [Candidatus Methylomirabilis lanthanidiphila]|uniref:Possibl zinc metallo-peptidase n=1 Tax=Candidatus Methylomirabilis lanthanidiphila TaxID=2211376 RepID=A0A564ZL85_9BACT|nr:metallopeptidase family protein [Candidatus Methylomirabilis lanthanidiphila]VUZ86091.1 Possibl zinc metallo-peptidase [Candidatus Methylomirabilis lanthanidiphila]